MLKGNNYSLLVPVSLCRAGCWGLSSLNQGARVQSGSSACAWHSVVMEGMKERPDRWGQSWVLIAQLLVLL